MIFLKKRYIHLSWMIRKYVTFLLGLPGGRSQHEKMLSMAKSSCVGGTSGWVGFFLVPTFHVGIQGECSAFQGDNNEFGKEG
jgi:hypothetical protein